MIGKYRIITLCGSTRFRDEFREAEKKLTLEGNIVISVGLYGHGGDEEVWENMPEGTVTETKEMLDDMHKRKIDLSDEIFVINKGGYLGESTLSEIDHAIRTGKRVRYLEEADWLHNFNTYLAQVEHELLENRPEGMESDQDVYRYVGRESQALHDMYREHRPPVSAAKDLHGFFVPVRHAGKAQLNAIMDAIDDSSDDVVYYLDLEIMDTVFIMQDSGEKEDEEMEMAVNTEPDRFLALPTKYDFHEYKVMADFKDLQEEGTNKTQLENALSGKGAFRRFRETCDRIGLTNAWYDYRDKRLRSLASGWCRDNGVDFE